VLDAHDEIAAALRLRGRGDDHAGIVFELLQPRTAVCRGVLEPDRLTTANELPRRPKRLY
jgi:hypothetical protein